MRHWKQILPRGMIMAIGLAVIGVSAVVPAHARMDRLMPEAQRRTSIAQTVPVKPNPARVQQKMREVEPEYRRRVLRDGKAAADAWLVRTARQWGIEEGRRARREYDADQRRAAEAQNRARLTRPPAASPSATPARPSAEPAPSALPAPIRQGLR